MVYRWPFHLGRAILQSEIVISIMLVRHLTAVGAIYKIVTRSEWVFLAIQLRFMHVNQVLICYRMMIIIKHFLINRLALLEKQFGFIIVDQEMNGLDYL